MTTEIPEELKKEIGKLKRDDDTQTIDLRLYVKEGRVQAIEPLDGKDYRVELLPDLRGQAIREVAGVALNQESPVCLYWYVYCLNGRWQKICLKWSD